MDLFAEHSSEAPSHDHVRWRFLFGFTRRRHLIALVPGICLSVASGGITPTMTIFVGKFFNAFSDYSAHKTSAEELKQRASLCLHAILALGLCTIILHGASCICWTVFGEMQARSVREELFERLIRRDIEWFEMRARGVGSLLSRLQTYLHELQTVTSLPMGNALCSVIEGVASLIVALHYSWRLTLVIMAALPLIALTMHLLSRPIQIQVARENEALTEASRTSNNAVTHISLIKCFNMQAKQLHHYCHSILIAGRLYMKQIGLVSLQVALVRFLSMIIFVVGFWYGNVLIHQSSLMVGQVVTTFWSTLAAVQAFQTLLPSLITFEKGRAAADALLTVLLQVNGREEAVRPGDGLYPDFCEGDIRISNVSFAYPARPDHNVLRDCSLHFPARTTSFLVGRSGSGKSTVGSLILGFYRSGSGTIRIDDQDIRYLDQSFVRNNITLVQQTSALFNESLLKNIDPRCNEDQDAVDSAQIDKCVQIADLSSTIAAMPDGLMTRIGCGGLALSGGQKQRVALCRACLRDTPVLILDEPTSALDSRSKFAIMENIRAWRSDMTTVIITHDTSLIQPDDLVHVMQDGKVTARGSWRDLSGDTKMLGDEGDSVDEGDDDTSVDTSICYPFQLDGLTENLSFHKASKPTQPKDGIPIRQDSLEYHLDAASRTSKLLALRHTRRTQHSSGLTSLHPPSSLMGSDGVARTSASDATTGVGSGELLRNPQWRRPLVLSGRTLAVTDKDRDHDKPLPLPPMSEGHGHEYGKQPQMNTVVVESSSFSMERDRPSLPVTKILWTALPLLGSKGRWEVLLGLVGTMVEGIIPTCFAFVLTEIFQTFYASMWRGNAVKYSLQLLAIAFGEGVVSFLTRYLLESSAQECSNEVRGMAMRKILAQPRAWFDQEANSSAYLTTTLDRNAEDLRNLLGRFIPTLLFGVAVATGTILWAVVVCWKLTLVALATMPAIYLLTRISHRASEHWEAQGTTAAGQIGDIFDETFTNIKTVRALTLESFLHRKYHNATNEAFSIGQRRGLACGGLFGLSKSSLNFVIALVFYYSADLAATTGTAATGKILHTLTLLVFGTAGMSNVMSLVPQLASAVSTSSRLIRLAQMTERSHENERTVGSGSLSLDKDDPTTLAGPIHFINTTFYYPTRPTVAALKQLNLCIPPGQCTAIVGRSGSGKSTIASLLLGLYPPSAAPFTFSSTSTCSANTSRATTTTTSTNANDHTDAGAMAAAVEEECRPNLTLSGRDIRTLNLNTLRDMIALVPQTPVIFPTTVLENIRCGLDPAADELARQSNVEQAAMQAGIHEFIMTLPNGYDTVIGDGGGAGSNTTTTTTPTTTTTGGTGLSVSGGQAQRIVLARALVRKPKILILDEPTSALDAESAAIIRQSIEALLVSTSAAPSSRRRGPGGAMTVIMITHARDMMSFADHVVVMEAGTVVEEGKYHKLIERKGKLWQLLVGGEDCPP